MFQLVDTPLLFPQLSLTRRSIGPMVDTEVVLMAHSRVYVTEIEGWEIVNKFETFAEQVGLRAAQLGWASPEQTKELQAQNAALVAELESARAGQPQVLTLSDAKKLLRV